MAAYRKAWAAFAEQRYDEARRWTTQAIQADPANPHAHSLAGDLAYLAHDLAGARRAWEQALDVEPRLRPLKERLLQLEREEALEQGRLAQQTSVFRVSVPSRASVDLDGIVKELEAAQAFLEQRLPCHLEGPVSVLVYDPEAFYGTFHVPTEVAGLFDGTIRLPMTLEPQPGWPSLQAVIWHELAHAAVHQLAHGRAPRWVHEGVAQVVQAQVEAIPTAALQIALRRREVPSIAQLEGHSTEFGQTNPIEAGVFYQSAWAHVAYLLEHRGWTGLRRLLEMLGTGRPSTEALQEVSGFDEDAWMRHWTRWIHAKQI